VLKEGGRSATLSSAGHRLRNTLVVAEVALAVMLLVGAGLFLGSFVQLIRIDPGFDYRGIVTLNIGLRTPPARTRPEIDENQKRGQQYTQQVLEAVMKIPAVEGAAAVNGGLPLTGSWSRTSVKFPDGREFRGGIGADDNSVDRRSVTPDYLALMRIPLRRGRLLNASDGAGAQQVVVINEAAAKKYWPDQDAIGQTFTMNSRERVVVGIVGDIRHLGPETPPRQEAYVPMAQEPTNGATLVIRTAGDPLAVLPAVKTAIWSINPEQRLTQEVVTLEGYMDRLIAQRRFNMAMLVLFGLLGLVITVAGIYGVMAYLVEQRTSEIGVRMALGATPRLVLMMVLRRASALMVVGLVIGAAAAWYLATAVQTFLFQIDSRDLRILAVAIVVLVAAGLVASAIPARRAARIDPLIALRQE
jgi:predicted permease